MDRRTDRAVAIAAAVTVVPLAILVVIKTGADGPSEKDPGTMPPNAAAAQHDPSTQQGRTPGAGASPAGTASPVGGAAGTAKDGTRAGAARTGKTSGGGTAKLPTLPPGTPKLASFVRVTDVRLTGAANGDYQHQTETATFTLSPRFSLNATGVRKMMKDGVLSTITQKVVVKDGKLSGYDGKAWTHSTLTPAQLDTMRAESDPRLLTALLRGLPGATEAGPDKLGSTHHTARTMLGNLYALMPKDVVAQVSPVLPGSTTVALDLWADRNTRPSWIGLNAAAPGTALAGSMTFRSYR
ncbi:hypothetical protein [Actinomadura sp. 9N407]|uniref:hypothetical protein n=1 Tax=Actinomadura sp. 9N407 TaxID=3375154 RepID=UPI003789F97A